MKSEIKRTGKCQGWPLKRRGFYPRLFSGWRGSFNLGFGSWSAVRLFTQLSLGLLNKVIIWLGNHRKRPSQTLTYSKIRKLQYSQFIITEINEYRRSWSLTSNCFSRLASWAFSRSFCRFFCSFFSWYTTDLRLRSSSLRARMRLSISLWSDVVSKVGVQKNITQPQLKNMKLNHCQIIVFTQKNDLM